MTAIVHTGARACLVAGLEWRQLFQPPGRAREGELRELARDGGADRVVLVGTGAQVHAGLLAAADDEHVTAPRHARLHSVAAILARMAGEERIVAALRLVEGGRVAVVAVEHGAPTVDVVQNLQKAHETVAALRSDTQGLPGHRLFTNDRAEFPEAEEALALDALAGAADAGTRLQRLPRDVRAGLLAAALGLLLAAGGTAAKMQWDARVRTEQQRAAREADPVRRYQAELAARIQRLGIPAGALADWARRIEDHPVWVAGWALQAITCRAGECQSEWERRGGTSEALQRARPGQTLELEQSSTERAVLRWTEPALATAGWPDLAVARRREQVEPEHLQVWQTWADARIRLQQGGSYAVWPPSAHALPADVTLKARSLEVRLALPLLREALAQTPSAVWWHEVRLLVDLSGKDQLLTAVLKGALYVR